MSNPHFRALLALMVLGLISLLLTRWLLKGTSLFDGFERRRNYWIVATLISFCVPHFFIAILLLAALYFRASQKDPQPIGFYLMFLIAVPPISRDIEGIGPINALFSINNFRLLSIAVLLPLAWRMFTAPKAKGPPPDMSPRVVDMAVILYLLYLVALYLPHDSVTQSMRRTLHMVLDFWVPYFVVSRYLRTRADVKDAIGAVFVTGLLYAPISIFEHFKGWLLWGTSAEFWGASEQFLSLYVFRDSALRAAVSSGHPLVWGHYLVACFGFLAVFRLEFKRFRLLLVWTLLILALYSTVSRSPWFSSAIVVVLMGLLTGHVVKFYSTLIAATGVISVAALFSPWADRLISFLPFIGSVDAENLTYRQQILDTTWVMVAQKPLLGDVFVQEQLEHLRQGQGIIDLVNVYAEIAMTYGLVGLALFLMFMLGAVVPALRWCLKGRKTDRELFLMTGATLLALLGSMVTLTAISNYLSVPVLYTSVVACLVVLVRLSRQPQPKAKSESVIKPRSAPGRAVVLR